MDRIVLARWALVALPFAIAGCHSDSGGGFAIGSSDVAEGGTIANAQVFNSFGCSGTNVSPEINWRSVPDGTKSLALTVFDPDAPTQSGFWHWTIYNIPPTVTEIPRGAGNP